MQIRLGWHDAGTYDKNIPDFPICGGANGSLRFVLELDHSANAGNPGPSFLDFVECLLGHRSAFGSLWIRKWDRDRKERFADDRRLQGKVYNDGVANNCIPYFQILGSFSLGMSRSVRDCCARERT